MPQFIEMIIQKTDFVLVCVELMHRCSMPSIALGKYEFIIHFRTTVDLHVSFIECQVGK